MKPILNKLNVSLSGIALVLVIGLTFFSLQAQAVPGQGTLYGTNTGELITIDPATGIGTVVGPNTAGRGFPGFAIDPVTGLSFAGCGSGCDEIWNFNLDDGMATFLGSMNGGVVAGGLDFSPNGVLFASLLIDPPGGTHLGVINTVTGEATVIGPFGTCNDSCTIAGIEAIAFDAEGNLWGSLRDGFLSAGAPGLYLINQNTGAATFVTSLQTAGGLTMTRQAPVSLQFACDGTLYGGTARSNSMASDGGFLVTINPDTGIFSFVGGVSATGGESLGGLSFDQRCLTRQIPTLSEWGLIAMAGVLGIIGLLAIRRRKVTA